MDKINEAAPHTILHPHSQKHLTHMNSLVCAVTMGKTHTSQNLYFDTWILPEDFVRGHHR